MKASHKMVFPGIKGLVASGPGTKKMPMLGKVRPEMDAKKVAQTPMKMTPKMTPAKTEAKMVPGGKVSVRSNIRPEGGIKRDAAKAVKP